MTSALASIIKVWQGSMLYSIEFLFTSDWIIINHLSVFIQSDSCLTTKQEHHIRAPRRRQYALINCV